MLLITPAGMGLDYYYCDDYEEVDLRGAKNYVGGSVIISNCNTKIHVEFQTDSPWKLVETHVHVGVTLDDIPHTKKWNAKPGKFEYSAEHDYVDSHYYSIPIPEGVECGE